MHGTTLDQIADAADVSNTNLFYYFATREDIYVAVLQQLLAGWLALLRALESDLDPAESIRNYIRMKIEHSRNNPASSRLFCLEIVQGAPLIGKYGRRLSTTPTLLRKLMPWSAEPLGEDAFLEDTIQNVQRIPRRN